MTVLKLVTLMPDLDGIFDKEDVVEEETVKAPNSLSEKGIKTLGQPKVASSRVNELESVWEQLDAPVFELVKKIS